MCVFQSTIKKQNERAHNLIALLQKKSAHEKETKKSTLNQFNETKLSTIEIYISISSETLFFHCIVSAYALTMLKHANRFD